MNLYEILKQTVSDCMDNPKTSDETVIQLLKMNLALKASDRSYAAWKSGIKQ